ncbi:MULTISPECIES: hypothetical protein [Sulfurimonas]|uniref:hypothetical protein n=1 Tax=Sulfurimonas TaxID=202746 RepID=UPI0012644C34|nr:hypothetical protein [Sulfurimonas indica]
MKPLHNSEITKFLERFDDFKESEIHSLKIISPTEIEITLTAQDKARAYDWLTLSILFSGVNDAKLIDESKLAYIDLDDGVSIIKEGNNFAFALGRYQNISSLKDAQLYIISQNIKYNEGAF